MTYILWVDGVVFKGLPPHSRSLVIYKRRIDYETKFN